MLDEIYFMIMRCVNMNFFATYALKKIRMNIH